MRVLLTIQTMSAMCLFIIVGSLLLSMILDYADDESIEEVSVELSSNENGQWPNPEPIDSKPDNNAKSFKKKIIQKALSNPNDSQSVSKSYDVSNATVSTETHEDEMDLSLVDENLKEKNNKKFWDTEIYRKSLKDIRNMAPDKIIKYATDGLISNIAKIEDAEYESRRDPFELASEYMLPPLDKELFAKLSIGKKSWESASPQQKEELTIILASQYVDLLSRVFMSPNKGVTVSRTQYNKKGSKARVYSHTIDIHDGSQVELNFMFYKKRDGSWYMYDAMIGGKGLVKNNRAIISESIHRHGLDETIKRFSKIKYN